MIFFVVLDMGYCRARKISKFGCGILSWGWLLCACVRCNAAQYVQDTRQLERRVSHSSKSTRSRKLPLCCLRKQDWFGKQSGKNLIHWIAFQLYQNQPVTSSQQCQLLAPGVLHMQLVTHHCLPRKSPLNNNQYLVELSFFRSQPNVHRHGVTQRTTFHTSRPVPRKQLMSNKHSRPLPKTPWLRKQRSSCTTIFRTK